MGLLITIKCAERFKYKDVKITVLNSMKFSRVNECFHNLLQNLKCSKRVHVLKKGNDLTSKIPFTFDLPWTNLSS